MTWRDEIDKTDKRLEALDRVDDLLEPAPQDIRETWVFFLSAGAGFGDPEHRTWESEAVASLGELPAGALTRDTLRAALLTFRGLPELSTLHAFLVQYAKLARETYDSVVGISHGEMEYRSWFPRPDTP